MWAASLWSLGDGAAVVGGGVVVLVGTVVVVVVVVDVVGTVVGVGCFVTGFTVTGTNDTGRYRRNARSWSSSARV